MSSAASSRTVSPCGRGEPYPQARRSGSVQRDAGPCEGQQGPVDGRYETARAQRVQRGVEQGRVHTERVRVRLRLVGDGEFGVDRVVAAPRGTQPLEQRTVAQAEVRQAVVEAVQVHRLGIGRGPVAQVGPGGGRAGGEDAGGVACPGAVPGSRVHAQRAATGVVLASHEDLESDAAVLGQHQRCLQGEFLDLVAAGLGRGVGGQFHEGRAR